MKKTLPKYFQIAQMLRAFQAETTQLFLPTDSNQCHQRRLPTQTLVVAILVAVVVRNHAIRCDKLRRVVRAKTTGMAEMMCVTLVVLQPCATTCETLHATAKKRAKGFEPSTFSLGS